MKRRAGKEGFNDLCARFEQCYFELGQALRTLDEPVEINTLFHQTLRGLLLMECSLVTPAEQAAILATTGNSLDYYYLVKIAMLDQWPHTSCPRWLRTSRCQCSGLRLRLRPLRRCRRLS